MLIELKRILQTLRNVRITEVAVEQKEGNNVLLRGRDKNGSIVVYYEMAMEQPPAYLMGIHKLEVFLDRLSLFNLEAAHAVYKHGNNIAKAITITEGRKKVSYTFADPDNISPKYVSDDEIIATLTISTGGGMLDVKTDIFKAIAAMNAEAFVLRGEPTGEVEVRLFDGVSDTYQDSSFEVSNFGQQSWEYKWRADSISLLLKESLKYNSDMKATMKVGARGLLFIEANGIRFTVLPLVEGL